MRNDYCSLILSFQIKVVELKLYFVDVVSQEYVYLFDESSSLQDTF